MSYVVGDFIDTGAKDVTPEIFEFGFEMIPSSQNFGHFEPGIMIVGFMISIEHVFNQTDTLQINDSLGNTLVPAGEIRLDKIRFYHIVPVGRRYNTAGNFVAVFSGSNSPENAEGFIKPVLERYV